MGTLLLMTVIVLNRTGAQIGVELDGEANIVPHQRASRSHVPVRLPCIRQTHREPSIFQYTLLALIRFNSLSGKC
ncbi:hypothetical protein CPB85DRAFT_1304703 [Mucidula mucida]|nr:hypothetical protein CPB85DRAFT_1304703 [Mucidula mucida]